MLFRSQIRNENEQGNKDSSCGCRGHIDYVLRLSDLEYLEKNKWMSYEDIFRFFVNLFNRMQSNSRI